MIFLSFFSSAGMDQNPSQYLFGPYHFAYIGVCLVLFFLFMKLFAHAKAKTRRIFLNSLLALMLLLKYGGEAIFVSEWVRYGSAISSFSHPFWDFRTFVSFQVCGMNNVLLPLVVWFNIKPLKDFVYTSSILGGIAVLLYPVGVLYGDPIQITFLMLRTLIVHFLLVFVPCFLMASGEFRLEKKRWPYTLAGAALMSAFAMYGNLFVDPGANNMYLMTNPFYGGPVPFLNILPNGIHDIFLVSLVFLGFVLIYTVAGWYFRHVDKRQRNAT